MEMDIDNKYSSDSRTNLTSSNTVLWFEFLVDPSLLIPHLTKQKPDPSPTELITKLLTVYQHGNTNSDSFNEQQEFKLRGVALKILALKVAAYLKWDLKILQSKLPLPIQIKFLEDLVYLTTGNIIRMAKQTLIIDIETASNEILFAAVLWHRWIVSGLVHRGLQQKNMRPVPQFPPLENGFTNMQLAEEFNRYLDSIAVDSIKFLHDVLASNRVPNALIHETFVALTDTSSEIKQNWNAVQLISVDEFHSQIHYDLATFYFFKRHWKLSKIHFLKCFELYQNIPQPDGSIFQNNYLADLKGYLLANGECFNGYQTSLLYKFYSSIRNGFAGTLSIMHQDNIERSLPLIHREITEVETFGAVSSEKYYVAKDILSQFTTMNTVRNVIDEITICPTKLISTLNSGGEKSLELLINAANYVVDSISDTDRKRLRHFFINIAPNVPQLGQRLVSAKISCIFTNGELEVLSNLSRGRVVTIPRIQDDFLSLKSISRDFHCLTFDQKLLNHKLIYCYDLAELQMLCFDWHKKTQAKPLWRINPKWQLPIPLQSVVMSIEDTMLQSIAYLILAKGRELMLAKDYRNSLRMYSQVDTECIRNSNNPATVKLWKLVSWELLLVKVIQYTEEWPANYMTAEEKEDLIAKCKDCLTSPQTDYTANVIPRTELIEHLSLFLLNVGEWEFIMALEKRWNYFELTTAVAYACQDLIKFKGAKKVNKDAWELILPVFGPSTNIPPKRGSSSSSMVHRDSPNAKTKLNILSFMSSLRNEHALGVMIALLARLYNNLRDESNLELLVDHISIWPAVVSNANSYNYKSVSEMLWQTLEIGLQYYPNNLSWLKLQGDINFCNDYPEAALKCYLKSLIVATDYFTQPILKPLIDDHTIKRMIKCCIEVNCYTQAVVLCQFLDQIDYTTAFQCLGEMKPGNCHDAMDAYYSCIWDTTILEYLIHLHHKRGEEHRKREAIKIMGHLELNSNNSDDIKREASDIRKRRFMRALAKQYVIKYPI